jgi:NAD(P)-dependent dehydrogenase (short-subunit alcohol dehydrogenase family)
MTLLTGKSVIITGIGPGLGRVIAEEAARLGADVAMVSRSGAIMAEITASVPAGARMIAIQADITSDADCAAVAEQTVAAFGKIDGLVNSAYRPGDIKPVMDIDLDELARAFDVTVLGTLRMIRAVVPQMERQGGGSIVNIGSQVARKHVMNQGGYAATKAAQSALTRYLAIELGPKNIRFNTPSFGWTISPPARAWLEQQEADGGPSVSESIAGIAGGLALNRVPADEEYARAALALVSDYFSSVTGATLDVNGGEYMPL